MAEISAEELIPLVEQKTVIWDKNSALYKDKNLRANAWREICCVLNPEFDNLEGNEMQDFVKSVSTKWIYIRDAFLRSQRTEKYSIRRGSAKKPRPYVYKNLLSFLTKVYEPPTRPDSCNEAQSSMESSSDSDGSDKQLRPPPAKKPLKIENITLDEKMTRFLNSNSDDQEERPQISYSKSSNDQEEHPHISFMKGMLPALASFDDDENLEFQAGVIALIKNIRRKRQSHEPIYLTY